MFSKGPYQSIGIVTRKVTRTLNYYGRHFVFELGKDTLLSAYSAHVIKCVFTELWFSEKRLPSWKTVFVKKDR